jgi:hypothetical protein
MNIIVHELAVKLSQLITVGANPINLEAILPHLYRHNQATGSLQIQVEDTGGNMIAQSEIIAISALPSDLADWHGYRRFYIKAHLRAGASYQISLLPLGGYSFSESAYVGWCNDFDLRRVPALYSPNQGLNAALDMQFWSLQDVNPGGS